MPPQTQCWYIPTRNILISAHCRTTGMISCSLHGAYYCQAFVLRAQGCHVSLAIHHHTNEMLDLDCL